MSKFNTGQSFADGDTVTGAKLNNITSQLNIYTGVISEQTAMSATVSTLDQLLIADTDNGDSGAANRITVQKLFDDSLTNGTYTTANLSGTITSNRTVATSATITTGTIPTLVSNNATIGTTTGTAGVFTSGTITTGLIPTLTAGTTTGTAGIFTSGTVTTLNSTTGTIATLNSTTGTIATLNSTTGTIATLNSTTGTITNLSTTLAGDFTITQGTGTIGTAKVKPTNLSQPLTSGVAVSSTSGTAIDFTSIPSWVKRITVMFNAVSTNGTSNYQVQLGTGGSPTTSGYEVYSSVLGSSTLASDGFTTGFGIRIARAAGTCSGQLVFSNLSGNIWTGQYFMADRTNAESFIGGGAVTLSGVLNLVRITTVDGANTFDAGSINIMYEG
jgi:nuclear pore complex protein Nup98-Nup96